MDATFGPITIHQPRGTEVKKTHIYTVTVSRNTGSSIVVHVRAESKAQARAAVANTMIHVERADNDTVLDLNRSDVIDANMVPVPADDQAALPLTDPDASQPVPKPDDAEQPTAAQVLDPA